MQKKGYEGDIIILNEMRLIECPIPVEFVSVGQIGPDLLMNIIARCLLLISEGEIDLPQLPVNIASRHRICTTVAAKIKELGFLSDCGYNQLLYPVESQTRELLKWLVERIPRSEEEGAEEVLGASGLLNRRIMQALRDWKLAPLRLPICSEGIRADSLRRVYSTARLRTVPGLLCGGMSSLSSRDVFRSAALAGIAVESSVFEKHALELVGDSLFAQMELDFMQVCITIIDTLILHIYNNDAYTHLHADGRGPGRQRRGQDIRPPLRLWPCALRL
jgi:hypothetical protein